jgi:Tfp pilus assembly protein PilF
MSEAKAAPSTPPADAQQARQLYKSGHYVEALRVAQSVMQSRASDVLALDVAAASAYALGRFTEAESYWLHALRCDTQPAPLHFKLANLYNERRRFDQAEIQYRLAVATDGSYFQAHNNFANFLVARKRFAEAEKHFRKALELAPQSPEIKTNFGSFLRTQLRYDEAEKLYRAALALTPEFINAWSNLGRLYADQRRMDEAETCFRHSLALDPDIPGTKYLFTMSQLLVEGRYGEGLPFFETRYDPRMPHRPSSAPDLPFTQWRGESLSGKSLLIWHEQGFGDVIQFARFAAILKKQNPSRITLACRKPLVALIQTLDAVDDVLDAEHMVMTHDYWTMIMSIPLHLGMTVATIPGNIHTLRAPSQAKRKMQSLALGKGLKIGLAWKGSALHGGDSERSMELAVLRPLWDVADVSFVGLQKGRAEADAAKPPLDQPLVNPADMIGDFADTAALIERLDLVISVDTAVAHLAGTLGKPVWLLLPYVPDWRWLHDRYDSPWYPTMRLFRQQRPRDWGDVVLRVKAALIDRLRH